MNKSEDIKTCRQIVDDANDLARLFYESYGCRVEQGYRFDKAHHPQEKAMWNLASIAYEQIEGTDVNDALVEVENDEESEDDECCDDDDPRSMGWVSNRGLP